MFGYAGHLREEEERPVSGIDWARDPECIGSPCPFAGTLSGPPSNEHTHESSNGRHPRAGSRRIDMAAMINNDLCGETSFRKNIDAEDLEATQIVDVRDWAEDSEDLKTEESSDDELIDVCGVLLCTPCMCRIWSAAMFLLALFLVGMGVGMAVRENGQGERGFSAVQGQGTTQAPGSSPPGTGTSVDSAPSTTASLVPNDGTSLTQEPQVIESTSPSSYPTQYFEFDVEDFIDEMEETLDPPTSTENTINEAPVIEWDNSASPYLVGVYYYPWHGSNFHNGDGYVRRDLTPQQQPALGEYDDSKPETIRQHLRWSRQANIGLWITSWWGPNRLEDTNTKDVIMKHEELGDLKVSIHYETSNRVRGGPTGISNDMQHMCDNYFDHPNYYKIGGRPVIFVYVTRKLESDGSLEQTILTMRTAASKCGHNLYLIGDHVFESAPEEAEVFVPFWYFDAVTNYDVYGSMGRPSPHASRALVDQYYRDQEQWRARAHESGCRYIPAVSPGYNDRGVRFERNHPPLSRKLSETSPEGSLFAYQLSKAKGLVDPSVDNLIVVNSFNEWHEDTQIEPVVGVKTNSPFNMTQGVEYEAYGELYLNLLRQWTIN